jgi:hypothetical protein
MFVSLIANMETENKNLSPQQSLDLISSMIVQTQGNLSSGSFYLLLWGWVIALCNFGMYALMTFTTPKNAAFIWLLTVPASITTVGYSFQQGKSRLVTTHLDNIHMWLWIASGITILPSWIFGAAINWHINAVVLMPIGLATFMSGIIIRFKPLLFGGITFWVAATLCYLVSAKEQYLVGGVAMVFGYLVPGYMLRKINR